MIGSGGWDVGDAELVARASNAESRQDALTAIYAKYGQRIMRYCMARLNEESLAEDAAHDTFHELIVHFRNGNTLHNPEALLAFLYTIARRRVTRYRRGRTPGKGHRPGPDLLTPTGDRDPADLDSSHAAAIAVAEYEMGATRVLEILDRHVIPSLTPQQQRIYENSVHRGLSGDALGKSLGISAKNAKNQAYDVRARVVIQALGAYLLYRNSAEHRSERCPELDRIVFRGISLMTAIAPTGIPAFTQQLREDIIHHFDTCATCGKCRVCGPLQRRLLAELAPVLIPILWAAEMRDRITQTIRRVCAESPMTPPRRGKRKTVAPLAAVIIILLIIGGALYQWRRHNTTAAPADPQAGMPLIAYTTPTALFVRHGNGPAQEVAALDGTVSHLVWSADSRHLAWLSTRAGSSSVHVADLGAKTQVSWPCGTDGCTGLAFLGNRLLSSTSPATFTPGLPDIKSYPTTAGGRPAPFITHGLPAPSADGAERIVQVFGSMDKDTGVLAYWSDRDANGQAVRQVFRLNATGDATPIGATGVDRPHTDVDPVPSPDLSHLIYWGDIAEGGGGGGDQCKPSDGVTVLDLGRSTSTTSSLPAQRTRPWRVIAAWLDERYTPYVVAYSQPGDCSPDTGTGADKDFTVQPHILRLDGSRWTDTGQTGLQGWAATRGWQVTRTGTLTAKNNLISSQNTVLTAVAGTRRLDLGSTITGFALAPGEH